MNNKLKKKVPLLVMVLVLFLVGGASKTAFAASFENNPSKGTMSSNVSRQNYDYGQWATTINSYLYQNEDGTYNRVEVIGEYIYSEIYSEDFEYQSCKKIKPGLPVVGGIYIREDGYFVIEGRNNTDAVRDTTEFRIIKYDKDWNKLAYSDLKDMNTAVPFDAGSCRFTEDNGMLYIRTCHEMYDGHQSSVMIKLDMKDCKVITADCGVANSSVGYVSHSFNQFLSCKDGVLYACDHGDAHPRGIVMMRFDLLADGKDYFNNEVKSVVPFKFAGEAGENYTGATLGGFGISSTHAVAVGSSIPQDSSGNGTISNIYITTTELDNFSDESVNLSWLTSYKQGGKRYAAIPQMVQLSPGHFFVMWEEYFEDEFDRMCYVIIDGTGKKISDINNIKARLSDCQPILCKDKIVWYVTEKSTPVFYQIPADGSEIPDMEEGTVFTKNGLKYKIVKAGKTDGRVSVTGYDKPVTSKFLEFGETVLYNGYSYKITEIGAKAFYKCKLINNIYIPSNITKIGTNAFNGCKNLDVVQLEYKKYSMNNIGKNAFKNIGPKAVFIVPKEKKAVYQKLLKKRGISKNATVTDIGSILYW